MAPIVAALVGFFLSLHLGEEWWAFAWGLLAFCLCPPDAP